MVCAGVVHLYATEGKPVVALRNVDLEVSPGEMLAVVGPSGSGKSTLLALLSGLLRPTAGKVVVAGHDMASLDSRGLARLRSTQLSLVLQEPLHNLLPYATAYANIAFSQRGARRRRWPLKWQPGELVEAFSLGSAARLPVHQLSGGEQQKVAVAAAMSTSPRILLADEPTCRIDVSGRHTVIDALQKAHSLSGVTVVVVTHEPALADAMPRSLAINHGVIGAEGRGGRRFVVVGRDGGVQLPAAVAALYPPGTLFEVAVADSVVELHPQAEP